MQSNNEEKQSKPSKENDKRLEILEQIKSRVTNNQNSLTFDDAVFELWALIGGYGDIVGREFDVVYKDNKVVKIIQQPVRTKVLIKLFKMYERYYERQEKMYKKNQRKGRR